MHVTFNLCSQRSVFIAALYWQHHYMINLFKWCIWCRSAWRPPVEIQRILLLSAGAGSSDIAECSVDLPCHRRNYQMHCINVLDAQFYAAYVAVENDLWSWRAIQCYKYCMLQLAFFSAWRLVSTAKPKKRKCLILSFLTASLFGIVCCTAASEFLLTVYHST